MLDFFFQLYTTPFVFFNMKLVNNLGNINSQVISSLHTMLNLFLLLHAASWPDYSV